MSQISLPGDHGEPSGAPKRKRASRPKVKTGCIVCKIRRVKCDETKPACLKCTSTGRKCEGYEQVAGQTAAARRKLVEEALSPPTTEIAFNKIPIPRSPSATAVLPIRDAAHTSFDFLRLNMVASMGGGGGGGGESEYRLWTSIVLQLSTTVPAVKLAATALGSLCQRMQLADAFHSKGDLTMVTERATALQETAEQEYWQALRSLREHLDRSDDEAAEAGLVSCWLMYAFEFLRGHARSAVVHQISGISILQKHLKETEERGSESRISSLRSQITKVFDAWDQRTTVWLGLDNTLTETIAAAEDPTTLPILSAMDSRSLVPSHEFGDLQEASVALRQLIVAIMFLRHRHSTWLVQEHEDSYIELETERQRLLFEVEKWRKIFDRLMGDSWYLWTAHEQNWTTLLTVNGRTAELRLSSLLHPNEAEVYASRGEELNDLLGLIESLLYPTNVMKGHVEPFSSPAAAPAGADERRTPYFNFGVIQPLYHIATKTQDPLTRDRAIHLLEGDSWDEGGFNSVHAGRVARKFAIDWDIDAMQGFEDFQQQEQGGYQRDYLAPMVTV